MQSSQSRTEATSARKRFRVILVKPSHYDDDGYVIRWFRSPMPANSLATVYGLVDDCAQRQVLGPDIDIDIVAIDETNTRVRVERIIAEMRANGNFGFVGLVGVQSNQYPRSLHIAKPLREAGIPVIIGGFHVSGMLAMFPDVMADLQEALDMGITLFAGEAEGRMDEVMRDAAKGALKPLYNYINDLPALEDVGDAVSARQFGAQNHRQRHDLRCRPRLPVPMLVLHHHQRAGPQIAPPQPRRRRAHPAQEFRARHRPVFHYRRQFRPQQGLGADLRPHHQAARGRRHGRALPHPGRHALPQNPEFRRQGQARRRHPHLHRAREHQSGQSARRQEAAEQDHRIPQHAAGVEGGRHLDLCRLHPRLSQRHAGIGAARHRDHQEGNAARRAGILLPDAAARLRGSQGAVDQGRCRSIPTSTNTISSTRSPRTPT